MRCACLAVVCARPQTGQVAPGLRRLPTWPRNLAGSRPTAPHLHAPHDDRTSPQADHRMLLRGPSCSSPRMPTSHTADPAPPPFHRPQLRRAASVSPHASQRSALRSPPPPFAPAQTADAHVTHLTQHT
eukprot:364365-Chlamydomonas_euryale.AAC.12